MLAYSNTEIEQILRDARLLFEKLDRVLDRPTTETEFYRQNIEEIVNLFKNEADISASKTKAIEQHHKLHAMYLEQSNL